MYKLIKLLIVIAVFMVNILNITTFHCNNVFNLNPLTVVIHNMDCELNAKIVMNLSIL